jgi:hypothetical protein
MTNATTMISHPGNGVSRARRAARRICRHHRARRFLTPPVATAAALLASTPAAIAASPPVTRQAAAANAAFLAYAPPPAGGAKALCLVDTSVNRTPDTAPGLVSATALDGGTGNDVDVVTHGTIDAAIAGGAGHGVLGAWPQLKIVSIRATDTPEPGHNTSYIYDDYAKAIQRCSSITDADITAIVIPLASKIPPTPDQYDEFVDAVALARTQGIGILAAAGNEPGAVQLPGSQPGIIPVGAGDTVGGGICPFSASTDLTFFAPGCTIDQIDTAGNTFCCGNGTSQASAFAAGVYVALRSYAPTLTAAQASQRLVSTGRDGHLDATAVFRAAGLGAIVDAGNAAIPKPPPPPAPPAAAPTPAPPAGTVEPLARPRIKRATWRRGVLRITLRGALPKGGRLHARVTFARRKAMFLRTARSTLQARTPLPRRVQVHLTAGGASSPTVTVKVVRLRR